VEKSDDTHAQWEREESVKLGIHFRMRNKDVEREEECEEEKKTGHDWT